MFEPRLNGWGSFQSSLFSVIYLYYSINTIVHRFNSFVNFRFQFFETSAFVQTCMLFFLHVYPHGEFLNLLFNTVTVLLG